MEGDWLTWVHLENAVKWKSWFIALMMLQCASHNVLCCVFSLLSTTRLTGANSDGFDFEHSFSHTYFT